MWFMNKNRPFRLKGSLASINTSVSEYRERVIKMVEDKLIDDTFLGKMGIKKSNCGGTWCDVANWLEAERAKDNFYFNNNKKVMHIERIISNRSYDEDCNIAKTFCMMEYYLALRYFRYERNF